MIRRLKTSFFWQFAGGFVIGAAGLFAMHPAELPMGIAPTHYVR